LRGGKYIPRDFSEYYEKNGIIHEYTPPYSPQSNGVAERKNKTICDLANALLQSSGMSYWRGEAVLTVNYVLNKLAPQNQEGTL
jgi:transposase InsO family protein